MSTDIKLSKSEISKKKPNQVDLLHSSWLDDLGKKGQTIIVSPLAKDNLSGLVSNLTLGATNKFEK